MFIKRLFLDPRFQFFIGGVAAATLGKKAFKSEKSRSLCVRGLAEFMKVQRGFRESFENIKEEATDLCHDAEQSALADNE